MKLSLISLISVSYAHIQVLNPPPRGSDELDSLTGPCGKNLNSPGSRYTANAGSFKITVQVADSDAKMVVNAGTGNNPGSFPINVASLTASLEVVDVNIDFSRISGLKDGDPVTLQVVETSLDGQKYACIDLAITGLSGSKPAVTIVPTDSTHSDHDQKSTTITMTEVTTAPSTTVSAAAGMPFSYFVFAVIFALLYK